MIHNPAWAWHPLGSWSLFSSLFKANGYRLIPHHFESQSRPFVFESTTWSYQDSKAMFTDLRFDNSELGDPGQEVPAKFFSILPFRTSKLKDEVLRSAKGAALEWAQITGIDAENLCCGSTTRGHLCCWAFPELSREKLVAGIILYDILLYYDGQSKICFVDSFSWANWVSDFTDTLDLQTVSIRFLGCLPPITHQYLA